MPWGDVWSVCCWSQAVWSASGALTDAGRGRGGHSVGTQWSVVHAQVARIMHDSLIMTGDKGQVVCWSPAGQRQRLIGPDTGLFRTPETSLCAVTYGVRKGAPGWSWGGSHVTCHI